MNNQPLVSILIACYNGQKYINTCLETCISQSYPNLDILIINDGSNDESLNILKKWESIDKRIRVISQKNVGLGETRNRLIKNCKGTYFTFVDIDDTIPNNAIELLVKNTDNNKNDVVAARSKLIYKNNSLSFPFIPSWRWVRNMTKGHYVKSNLCTPWGCLIKTSYYKSLNINFIPGKIFEDIGVMTYVFLKSKNFKFIKDVVYNYHKHKKDKFNEKQLSSFHTMCYKKNDDVYYQTYQLFNYLSSDKNYNTKAFKRYVNGILFQIIPLNIFLTKNLTNNKYFQYILRYNMNKLLNDFQIRPKYSKTPWKSLAFLYIYMKNFKVYSKKDKFNDKLVYGSYTNMIHNNKYQIIPSSLEYPLYPRKNKIYELPVEQVSNNTLPLNLNKINIALTIKKYDKQIIEKAFNNIYKMNTIPFASITCKLLDHEVDWILSKCIGINIHLNKDNYTHYYKIIDSLTKDPKTKKIIYITVKNFNDISNELLNKVSGVFLYEDF